MPAHAGAAPDMPAAEAETYGPTRVHIYHGEQGAQAYIRDPDLGAEQARLVAAVMARDLARAGTQLAGLTVNGRLVAPSAKAPGEEEREPAPADAQEGPVRAPRPSIMMSRKGGA